MKTITKKKKEKNALSTIRLSYYNKLFIIVMTNEQCILLTDNELHKYNIEFINHVSFQKKHFVSLKVFEIINTTVNCTLSLKLCRLSSVLNDLSGKLQKQGINHLKNI